MTIAILGATGRVGSHLATMLIERGYVVRLLVRDPSRLPAAAREHATIVVGDARDPSVVAEALAGAAVAVSTLGGTGLDAPGTFLSEAAATLVAAARAHGLERIVWVAASGLLDAAEGGLRSEAPGYPPVFALISKEHRRVWETMRTGGMPWTIVCPPHMPTGARTGIYRVEADRLPEGGRQITDADVADFIAGEIEAGEFVGVRVGIAY